MEKRGVLENSLGAHKISSLQNCHSSTTCTTATTRTSSASSANTAATVLCSISLVFFITSLSFIIASKELFLFPSIQVFPLFFFSWKSEEMERQRSFSFKHTRFLIFSFVISSAIFFIFFFSLWIFKETPSTLPVEINLEFNTPSLSFGLNPIKFHALTGISRNFTVAGVQNPIFNETHFKKSGNVSGNGLDLVVDKGIDRNNSKVEPKTVRTADEKSDKFSVNLVKVEEKKSSESNEGKVQSSKREVEDSILSSTLDRRVGNSSRQVEVPGVERIEVKKNSTECVITNGKWVFDESYPLYTSKSCPFIDEGFSCEANGRLNKNYMKWRWQPHDCNIPRFSAVKMLELLRGKRLVFVGDSINRNQWESMLCLLRGAIKDPKRVYETHGRRITKEKGNYSFKFVDYDCTVEYYVTHFLVHESKARVGKKRVPTLRIDALDRGSSRWKGADILVFNSAHWWSHFKTKSGVNYYQERNQVHPYLDVPTAFRRALMTWASWVDKQVTSGKSQVFFRSSAPSHFRGGQWNSGGHCKEENQPLNDTSTTLYTDKNVIVEEVIKQMKTPVTLLNITSLSEFRIDGHPSIYGKNLGKGPPTGVEDCSHWCLPGVPDTWNELLYFYLQSNKKSSSMV